MSDGGGVVSLAVSLDVTAIPAAAAGAGRSALEIAETALDGRHDVSITLITRKSNTTRCTSAAPRWCIPSRRPCA